ncbi:MAG TPA: hypothetical protein VFM21_11235, partial [Terriglobia bacterium]|nr:hypothetical protein [Terriglobia bacterium]
MSAALWLNNLGAYWAQVAILVVAGTALLAASRLRAPRATHAFWQALLVTCLILPWVQPWQRIAAGQVEILGITTARFDPAQTASRFAWLPSARIVLLILAAGILMRLLWLAVAYARLRRSLATAQPLEPLPDFAVNL